MHCINIKTDLFQVAELATIPLCQVSNFTHNACELDY